MIQSIIFDLDGTMWDSTGSAVEIWNNVLSRHPDIRFKMTQETAEMTMGHTMDETGRILFPDISEEERNCIIDEMACEEVSYLTENGAVLYDGLENVLSALRRKYKLYIVSNSQDGYVQAFLHAHKLSAYFEDIEMSGRTGLDKGRNIALIIERNHIQSAVYVGDTEGDENASRFAGIPFIHAAYGFSKAVSPDAVISKITDLPECVDSL